MVEKCKICGDAAPPGKELCWCCEHGPKLHSDNSKTLFDAKTVQKPLMNTRMDIVGRLEKTDV